MKSLLQPIFQNSSIELLELEEFVQDLPGAYKGLDPRALYTGQKDITKIFEHANLEGNLADLGAGIGIVPLVFSQMYPDRQSWAVELSPPRIEVAKKIASFHEITNINFIQADLLKCKIPEVENYFLYFPTGPVLDRILSVLYGLPIFQKLIVIESHGDMFPRLSREPWLKICGSVELEDPRHHPSAMIFRRIEGELFGGPHLESFKENVLEIDGHWLGDSFGLEWLGEDNYQLLHPPRTIKWSNVSRIFAVEQLGVPLDFLMRLRRISDIRKIRHLPSLSLELPSGVWVEWDTIEQIFWGQTLCYDRSSSYFFLPRAPLKKLAESAHGHGIRILTTASKN